MPAGPATIAQRKAQCRACQHAVLGPKQFLLQCRLCGCVLAAKVAFTRAKCPIGKW